MKSLKEFTNLRLISISNRYYYHGDYENEINLISGKSKQTFYIYGLNGLCAMYKITDVTGELYYTHTDHLGSIIAVTDDDNTILEHYNYDAWGRRRNPTNYSYSGFTTSITNRGYTGHEHIDAVSLINMNGRTYDPILGRMLSPDNYVQVPDFTQSLNRYSYCMNNPLILTDPNGEWWGIDDAVVFGIGFVVGYINYGMATDNWGWKAAGAGLLAGAAADVIWNTGGAGAAALADGAGSAGSFGAGLTAAFASSGGSYAAQFAAISTLNTAMIHNELDKADDKGWDGVWLSGAMSFASALSTSTAPLAFSYNSTGYGWQQIGGLVLSTNLADNFEGGQFKFNKVHAGPVGYDTGRDDDIWGGFYTIGSKGLSGSDRFNMGMETLLSLSLFKDFTWRTNPKVNSINGCGKIAGQTATKYIPFSAVSNAATKAYYGWNLYELLFHEQKLEQRRRNQY